MAGYSATGTGVGMARPGERETALGMAQTQAQPAYQAAPAVSPTALNPADLQRRAGQMRATQSMLGAFGAQRPGGYQPAQSQMSAAAPMAQSGFSTGGTKTPAMATAPVANSGFTTGGTKTGAYGQPVTFAPGAYGNRGDAANVMQQAPSALQSMLTAQRAQSQLPAMTALSGPPVGYDPNRPRGY